MKKLILVLAAIALISAPLAQAEPHLPKFCDTHSGADLNPVCGKVDVSNGGCGSDEPTCQGYVAPPPAP